MKKKRWQYGLSRLFSFDPNSTKNEGRFRLYPPSRLSGYFRRTASEKGISYVIGKDKNGKDFIQAIRFDKSIWTEEKASKWWASNKDKYKFYKEK